MQGIQYLLCRLGVEGAGAMSLTALFADVVAHAANKGVYWRRCGGRWLELFAAGREGPAPDFTDGAAVRRLFAKPSYAGGTLCLATLKNSRGGRRHGRRTPAQAAPSTAAEARAAKAACWVLGEWFYKG